MNRRRKARKQRGVALLMVLVALTILGVMTVDLMETSNVYLATAVNSKNAVQAEYMARSGVNLSRLVLSFQRLLGNTVKFPFWEYADLVVEVFTDPEGGMLGDLAGWDLSGVEGLGLPIEESELSVDILDEDSKLNINAANSTGRHRMRDVMFQQLGALMAPIEYDYIFDRDLKSGDSATREEIICEIMDWSDGDEDLCDLSGSEDPSYYQMLTPEYERKNAPFDSLLELHMVHGVDDDVYAAFVDPDPRDPKKRVMTVWGKGRVNVNTAPPQVLLPLVCMMATDETGISPCNDPMQLMNLLQILQGAVIMRQFMPFNRTSDFIAAIQSPERLFLSIPGFPLPASGELKKMLTTKSAVFSIYSEATVGKVTKRIHMVVDMKAEDTMMLELGRTTSMAGGKVLYWRME